MRSVESDHFDVLVLGDSVVNGGALLDQADIATERVAAITGELVGNVAAGSWGPPNILAYVQRFGWFGAGAAVFVFSASDLTDVPLFPVELGPDFPLSTPPSALWEAVTRYLPRYLPTLAQPAPPTPLGDARPAAATLLALAAKSMRRVCVLFHRTLDNDDAVAEASFSDIARAAGVTFIALHETPDLYQPGDPIHLNKAGQASLAKAIIACVTPS